MTLSTESHESLAAFLQRQMQRPEIGSVAPAEEEVVFAEAPEAAPVTLNDVAKMLIEIRDLLAASTRPPARRRDDVQTGGTT